MRSRFHIAIRIDFSFWAQLPLFRNCFLCTAQLEPHIFQSIKCIFSQIILFLFFITALIAKTSRYFDKEFCIFKHTGSFQCMFIRWKAWNLVWKVEWPKCWNLDTPGARFYLTICFAGTVRYFHSLAGCDVEAWTREIPMRVRSGTNEWKNGERRRWDVRWSLELIKKTLQSRKIEKSV